MSNKGKVVSREKLMEQLWETDSFVDENTLSVNVNRLRKRICDRLGHGITAESNVDQGTVITLQLGQPQKGSLNNAVTVQNPIPPAFAKPHDKSCFLAALQLILLIMGAVALFTPL